MSRANPSTRKTLVRKAQMLAIVCTATITCDAKPCLRNSEVTASTSQRSSAENKAMKTAEEAGWTCIEGNWFCPDHPLSNGNSK